MSYPLPERGSSGAADQRHLDLLLLAAIVERRWGKRSLRPAAGALPAARLAFRNLGDERFEELIDEAGSGVAAAHTSRGCAFGDFDNDGDVDVLVLNMNEPPSLLRNDVSGDGHWLKVLLAGVKSNRSAIGARVVARYSGRIQTQDLSAQSSFYSANDRRLHFGLGEATVASHNPVAQRQHREDPERRSRSTRRDSRGSGNRAPGENAPPVNPDHGNALAFICVPRARTVRGLPRAPRVIDRPVPD